MRAAVARIGLPVLVQPMIAGCAELLAGVVQDPGLRAARRVRPRRRLRRADRRRSRSGSRRSPTSTPQELVTGGKAGALVAGFRGAPPASDDRALVDLVLRLARLAEDLPEVAELDLNPVLGLEQGCVAVDARIRISRTEQSARLKTW